MLKVLLFVPHHIDAVAINHDLVSRLAESYPEEIDVQYFVSGENHKTLQLDEYDLIHFFGCWSHAACALATRAYAHGLPYIVTPLGGLQPWETSKRKRTILSRRQRQLVERAAAVHVCGKLEHDNFVSLGWNKRIAIVKNPVLTSLISFEEAADQIERLYRKVIDSNCQLCLKPEIHGIIGTLLQIGTDPNAISLNPAFQEDSVEEFVNKFTQFSTEDWRRLLIYSDQEHITDCMLQAFDALEISHPMLDVSKIDRFEPMSKYVEGKLVTDSLLSKNILLKNKVKDVFDNNGKNECQLCLAILNIHFELNHHSLPLSHFVDLYSLTRFRDVDEDLVRDMVSRLNIEDLAARLTSAMSTFLGLPDGFWIFEPLEGKKTNRMIRQMTKFGLYNY
jgi:hypothetical protein